MARSSRPSVVAVALPPTRLARAAADIWARGDAILPLDPSLAPAECSRIAANLGAAAIVDEGGAATLPGAVPAGPGTAAVVLTSGTSGPPKAAELGSEAMRAAADATVSVLGLGPRDRWLCCVPTHHISGLQILVRSGITGTDPIVHDRFDVDAVAAVRDAAVVSLVPTMLARLLDAGDDVARWRWILLGGAPAPPSLIARARAQDGRIVVTYGMTETCGGIVYDGRPLPGADVRLSEQDEIFVRGPMLFSGYRNDPPATASAMSDGWLRTADLGALDESGRLTVLGRRDGVIVTGGEKVAARYVAGLLRDHAGVADAAVVGVPDPHWGERVVALVVASGAIGAADLRDHVRARAGRAAVPKEIVMVPEIPRGRSGGVDVAAVRAIIGGR